MRQQLAAITLTMLALGMGLTACQSSGEATTAEASSSASVTIDPQAPENQTCDQVLSSLRTLMKQTGTGLAPRTPEQTDTLNNGLAALEDATGLCPPAKAQTFRETELAPWLGGGQS